MQESDRQSALMDTDLPEWYVKSRFSQPGRLASLVGTILRMIKN